MNKTQLKSLRNDYAKKIEEIDAKLELMENGFQVSDKEKPFKKYNVNEMNDLYRISEKAFKYLSENPEETALDYNGTVPKDDRIIFAD